MSISIDEAIRILKAEIISQDTQLPARRISPLQEAFACLKSRFKTRKNILALLGMSEGVLRYLEKHQTFSNPDCLDFLKEAMAHVVNIYEEGKFDPQQEDLLGKRMYKRFESLRKTLKSRRQEGEKTAASPAGDSRPAPAQGGAGATAAIAGAASPKAASAPRPWEYTPAASDHCLTIMIEHISLALATDAVALVEEVSPRKLGSYISSNQIPVKDFARLFRSLAGRFKGPLAAIPSRRLNKLHLPLVVPTGGDLPLLPDENAKQLLVLSHGQWHGVILATVTSPKERTIRRWQAAANGDISGLATLNDENVYPLLNPRFLLEREGFLIATKE